MIPEKWCIARTEQNYREINEYFNTLPGTQLNTGHGHFMHSERLNKGLTPYVHCQIQDGFTPIDMRTFQEILKGDILGRIILSKAPPPVRLFRKQLIEAYDKFLCPEWKDTIKAILSDNLLVDNETPIDIPIYAITKLRQKGDSKMVEYAKEFGIILGTPIELPRLQIKPMPDGRWELPSGITYASDIKCYLVLQQGEKWYLQPHFK